MKKDVIVLKCKECGEEFLYEYSGRGAKPSYCPDCRKKVTMRLKEESKEKWKLKKQNLTQQYESLQKTVKVPTIDDFKDNSNTDVCADFVDTLIRLLKELDSLRVNLCSLATELNQYQSTFDKNDQYYMHRLEDLDLADTKEMQKLVKSWKLSRTNRRDVKDLIILVSNTIEQIPYKNLSNALPTLKRYNYKETIYDPRRTNI